MDLPGLLAEIAIRHLWQGVLIVGIVTLLLAGRQLWSAEQRSWIWTSSLLLIVFLPLATLIELPKLSLFAKEGVETGAALPASISVSQTQAPLFNADIMAPVASLAEILPLHLLLSVLVSVWLGVAVWKLFQILAAARHTLALEATLEPCALSTDMVPANWPENIDIMQSDAVETPMAIGLFSNRVVLPSNLVYSLPSHQICHILSHELAHIKRGDLPIALVQRVIEAVFWWSPLTWFIANNLREEREMACDDRAVRMNGCSRQYASALIESVTVLVTHRRHTRCDMLAVTAFDHHSRTAFAARVRRLIGRNYRSEVRFGSVQMASVGMAGLAVAMMFFLAPRAALDSNVLKADRPYAMDSRPVELIDLAMPMEALEALNIVSVSNVSTPRIATVSRAASRQQAVSHAVAYATAGHDASVQEDVDFHHDIDVHEDEDCDDDVHADDTQLASIPGPRIEIETVKDILDNETLLELTGDTEIIIRTREDDRTIVKRIIRHDSASNIAITAENGSTMTMTIKTDVNGNQTLSMSGGGADIVALHAPYKTH